MPPAFQKPQWVFTPNITNWSHPLEHLNLTMIEGDKFLNSLGWLKGEPTAKPEGPLPGGK